MQGDTRLSELTGLLRHSVQLSAGAKDSSTDAWAGLLPWHCPVAFLKLVSLFVYHHIQHVSAHAKFSKWNMFGASALTMCKIVWVYVLQFCMFSVTATYSFWDLTYMSLLLDPNRIGCAQLTWRGLWFAATASLDFWVVASRHATRCSESKTCRLF